MKKEKMHLTERILNHALGIIYLLTGEEYVIVKKNSPHSATHLLAGEVPIKCGDVSIYFSMEEWDFIEEHKDLYQEVTAHNQDVVHSSGILADNIPDSHENVDTVSNPEVMEGRHETRQKVEALQDICAEFPVDKQVRSSHNEKGEDETNENDIVRVEIDSDNYSGEFCPRHVSDNGQMEMLLATSYEQEIHDNTWAVHPVPTDGSVDRACLQEHYTMASSPDESAEEEIGFFHGFQGDNSPVSSPSYQSGNPTFTSMSEQCKQSAFLLSEKFGSTVHEEPEGKKALEIRNVRKCSERLTRSSPQTDGHTVNVEEKSHRCDDCGKYFDYKSNLIRHQRTHTGEKPFDCNECDKRYTTKSHLTIHKRTHRSGKPHRCDECGKHFTYKSQIAMHQRTHTGEKPHTCNLCGKNFAYKSYLIIHQRIHSGERPHVCPQCGKGFTDKSNLRKHQNTHTEIKPYVCRACGKHFNSKYSFTNHQRTHQTTKSK